VMAEILTITVGWTHTWTYCNCWYNCLVCCPQIWIFMYF
jgi:hypothetical protein